MNREIARQRRSIDGHIETLESRRESYTVADVVFRYQVEHDSLSLLHYIDLQIKQRERSGRFGSVAALRSTRASVAAFLGSKIAVLADVNGTFVRDYEAWLLRRGVCPNTVCYYMRNLKSVYNQAMLDGYPVCCNNPFRFVYVRPQRTVKRALDRDAMRRIADIDLSAYPHLEQARDLFMFSFFSRGMPFVDMVFLQKSAVSGGVISYRRHKTNQWLHVEVTPQLKTLMEKYANDSPWVFPLLEGTGDKLAQYKHYRLALDHEHDRNGHKTGRSSIPGTKPDKNHGGRPAGGFQSGLPKRPGFKRINCCLQTSSQKSIFTLPLTYPGYNPGLHIY